MSNSTNIDLILVGFSDFGKAYEFEDENGRSIWLPSSQIGFDMTADVGEVVDVDMPEWLAIKEGLV